METKELKYLRKAVEKMGNQAAVAKLLGVNPCSVWWWLNKSFKVPPQYVIKLEEATGVKRHQLRPDIYPREK